MRLSNNIFFIDRSIGKHIFPGILREAGIVIEVHDDHFNQDEADTVWIPTVAKYGWISITTDKRIRTRSQEKQAVLISNTRMIAMSSNNVTQADLAHNFVNTIHKIERFIKNTSAPFIASLTRPSNPEDFKKDKPGDIRKIYPK
jgi:PIN like domain